MSACPGAPIRTRRAPIQPAHGALGQRALKDLYIVHEDAEPDRLLNRAFHRHPAAGGRGAEGGAGRATARPPAGGRASGTAPRPALARRRAGGGARRQRGTAGRGGGHRRGAGTGRRKGVQTAVRDTITVGSSAVNEVGRGRARRGRRLDLLGAGDGAVN